jgi:hypothetical protein
LAELLLGLFFRIALIIIVCRSVKPFFAVFDQECGVG